MWNWIESLALGVVQGLTEFLPVSSDGHLVITQKAFEQLTGREHSGEENLFFDVMLHLGTLAAILVYYRAVLKIGARGLAGHRDVPSGYQRPALIRVATLAIVATLPLIPLALFFLKWIKAAFDSATATGIGFLVTAGVLLLTTRLGKASGTGKGPAETSWRDALLIGLVQMFAPLPGVSRSGLTVATALGLGFSKAWAVGFSLLIAIPAILGAAVKEIKDVDPSHLTPDRVAQTVAATIVAGIVGYAAIVWLVKIVRAGRMWYFSVYLIVLAMVVLSLSTAPGAPKDARREEPADGTARSVAPGGVAPRDEAGGLGALDRADTAGPFPGPGGAGASARVEPLDGSGLVLGRSLESGPGRD